METVSCSLTVNVLEHHREQEVPRGHVGLLVVDHRGELVEADLPGGRIWGCGSDLQLDKVSQTRHDVGTRCRPDSGEVGGVVDTEVPNGLL